MEPPQPKTLAQHIDFHYRMARLMLWFAWNHRRQHPEEPMEDILRQRTQLWRFSALPAKPAGPATAEDYAAPEWRKLLDPLLDLCVRTANDPDAARFEEEGFALFQAALEAKARARFPDCTPAAHGEMGALSYDPPKPASPGRIGFHIDNSLQPRSIFDDPAYLPQCLRALMRDAETRFGANELATSTWLNSYPRFLRNFPPEYTRNLGPEKRVFGWGDGVWGQFWNARGCFNEKHGDYLRRTSEAPYWPRMGWCSFETLHSHLNRICPESQ
jgi:hypothetical protein